MRKWFKDTAATLYLPGELRVWQEVFLVAPWWPQAQFLNSLSALLLVMWVRGVLWCTGVCGIPIKRMGSSTQNWRHRGLTAFEARFLWRTQLLIKGLFQSVSDVVASIVFGLGPSSLLALVVGAAELWNPTMML